MKKRLAELAAFRRRLEKTSGPPFNTVQEFRKLLGMDVRSFAVEHCLSCSRIYGIEAGATASVPMLILELAEMLLGPGAAGLFQTSWDRYRASLAEEVKKELTQRYSLLPSIASPTEANPCAAINCAIYMLGESIEICKGRCCSHRWQRASREDRAAREAADRSVSANPGPGSSGGGDRVQPAGEPRGEGGDA